jgi:hypothetical protein
MGCACMQKLVYSFPYHWESMRTYIFTERERRILEAYLTEAKVDKIEVSKIMHRFRKYTTLFEDVYLYLRVRKTMTT